MQYIRLCEQVGLQFTYKNSGINYYKVVTEKLLKEITIRITMKIKYITNIVELKSDFCSFEIYPPHQNAIHSGRV